ncbi:MAG: hypothetical protein ACKVP2_16665 [Burkholderiales bacterium]
MNKVFAAILGASMIAMGAGFVEIVGTGFLTTVSTQTIVQSNDTPGIFTS